MEKKPMNKYSPTAASLLPFPVILAATQGDVIAMDAVLKHFEGYIATLSTKWHSDETGSPQLSIDEELRRRLESKLISKVLAFKIA
jgi:hypothetical protein